MSNFSLCESEPAKDRPDPLEFQLEQFDVMAVSNTINSPFLSNEVDPEYIIFRTVGYSANGEEPTKRFVPHHLSGYAQIHSKFIALLTAQKEKSPSWPA